MTENLKRKHVIDVRPDKISERALDLMLTVLLRLHIPSVHNPAEHTLTYTASKMELDAIKRELEILEEKKRNQAVLMSLA